jgi:hypothetical protein
MRGRVRHLRLTDLARTVFLGPEYSGTNGSILLSHIRDLRNLEDQTQGGPVITPDTGCLQFASYDLRGFVLLITSRNGSRRKHCSSVALQFLPGDTLFAEPLLSNGCCIAIYFGIFAQQRVYMPHYLVRGLLYYLRFIQQRYRCLGLHRIKW